MFTGQWRRFQLLIRNFCLIRPGGPSTAADLFWCFCGISVGTSHSSSQILLSQRASIISATVCSCIFVFLFYCTAPHGWRCPPSHPLLPQGERTLDKGIPFPPASVGASRLFEKQFAPGCRKNQIKNELFSTIMPAFAVPLPTSDAQPAGEYGRLAASDFCPHTLQRTLQILQRTGYLSFSLFFRQLKVLFQIPWWYRCVAKWQNFHSATHTKSCLIRPFQVFTGNRIEVFPERGTLVTQVPALQLPAAGVLDDSPTGSVYCSGDRISAFICVFTARHDIFCTRIPDGIHIPPKGLWQRYPFCWFPDAHIRISQQKPNVFASQTPGSVSALSCIMVERNSQQLNISTTAQHLLNCYLI